MKTIGLSGVMGAGKSSVTKILKELGIYVLDCDEINAKLLLPGEEGYRQVMRAFDKISDAQGKIDDRLRSAVVFHDEQKRKKLEAIMHPLIKKEIEKQLAAYDGAVAVVEVPLLFEIHWEAYFDEIWCVCCPRELLLQRLQTGRNISREEALKRLRHQMPQEEKCKRSDVVLVNDGSREALKAQILRALHRNEER